MQTSFTEADHYSQISQCNNVEPWWRLTPKVWDHHYLHHNLGMLPLLHGVSFAHLHILEYPDQHQNLISSSLYYPGPLHPNPFITFWVMLSTDKQTDRQTNANKNVTSFPKEVIKIVISFFITLLPIHILAPTPPIASCNCWIPWASYPFSIFDSLHHPGLWQLSNMVSASFMVSQTHITQLHKDSRS